MADVGHPRTGGWFKNTSAWLALDWCQLARGLWDDSQYPLLRLWHKGSGDNPAGNALIAHTASEGTCVTRSPVNWNYRAGLQLR